MPGVLIESPCVPIRKALLEEVMSIFRKKKSISGHNDVSLHRVIYPSHRLHSRYHSSRICNSQNRYFLPLARYTHEIC